jgi:hypothetical protein
METRYRSFKEIGSDLTDKVYHHGYDRFYPLFLEPLRALEFNMIEIGLDEMGSFKLWSEYFPKAKIWGVDIQPKHSENNRLTIIQADQSIPTGIEKISQSSPNDCEFIIDDGSHVPEHQIKTFHHLFQHNLKPGGVYIIEDIECSYWKEASHIYGYDVGPFNITSHFKNLADGINQEFNGIKNTLGIETVTFAYNSIIVTKSKTENLELYNRDYRFKYLLK